MLIFNDSNSFSTYIEKMVREHKGLSHMEAVLKYCNENFVEPSDVKKLINKSLKQKIQVDFENDGYLPKTATLDI
jgi:hypothetical protein